MMKNGLIIGAMVSFLVLLALYGSVTADDMIIEVAGDIVINQSSMSATPQSVSLANGPDYISFNATDITGNASPADNYTWIISDGMHPPMTNTSPASLHNNTFTYPGSFAVTLVAENNTYTERFPELGEAKDVKPLEGGVLATVPIEGNFTSVPTATPFQILFNFTFNNTQYRGIPTHWTWEFFNSTGKFDTRENTVANFTYNFPVIPTDYTYTVNVRAYNTSPFVVDNYSSNLTTVRTVPLIVANFTASSETCPSFPVDVTFKDNSTGYLAVDSQRWDFNDTTTSNQINPVHQYNRPGTFRVNYTAINSTYNFQNSSQKDVSVSGLFANFTYNMNPASGEFIPGQGILVNFTSTSEGYPTNFLWNFGDDVNPDNPVTLHYANHTYTRQGTYNASLTVFRTCDGSQIQNTTVRPITVIETMITNFTYWPNSGKYPLPVQFHDSSSDSPIQWEWWFYDKDGITLLNYSSIQNPSLVYNSPGSYRVKLHTVNARSQTGTHTRLITLYDGISADFTADKTIGIFPFLVNFTDTSTPSGQATNWNWTFGDEKPGSTSQNPSHTYERKGNFTVSLTASNSQTSDTKTKGAYISVGTMISPDFTPKGQVPARAPFVVNFTDQSLPADEVSGWQWSFSDGGQASGKTVSHQFPSPGVYNVTLVVSSAWDTKNVTHQVNITEIKIPEVDFIFSPSLLNAGEKVTFSDRTSGSRPMNWTWRFGDGETSHEQNPEHVYIYAGQYYPSLTVSNMYGENTKNSTMPVSVRGPVIPSFTTDKPDWWSVINQPVMFIDTSKGQPVSWVWDFADGTAPMTVSVPQVSHTYTKTGIFNVTMTATNWYGDTKTAFHSFEVTDKDVPRNVNFVTVGKKYSGNHPLTVQFEDQTPNQSEVTEWYWDYGDRTNEFFTSPKAPSHTYTLPGEYTVTLTVRNDMGVNEKIRVAYVVVV
jgi:PKD repeat protein